MSQSSAWSHLPNAKHIDRVLAVVKAHPQVWVDARGAAWGGAQAAAWAAALDAARDAAWDAAWDAALDAARDAAGAAWDAAWAAAWGACAALIAWDDVSEYLKFSPEHLRVLSALEDHKATLLLPAALALQTEPVDQ